MLEKLVINYIEDQSLVEAFRLHTESINSNKKSIKLIQLNINNIFLELYRTTQTLNRHVHHPYEHTYAKPTSIDAGETGYKLHQGSEFGRGV